MDGRASGETGRRRIHTPAHRGGPDRDHHAAWQRRERPPALQTSKPTGPNTSDAVAAPPPRRSHHTHRQQKLTGQIEALTTSGGPTTSKPTKTQPARTSSPCRNQEQEGGLPPHPDVPGKKLASAAAPGGRRRRRPQVGEALQRTAGQRRLIDGGRAGRGVESRANHLDLAPPETTPRTRDESPRRRRPLHRLSPAVSSGSGGAAGMTGTGGWRRGGLGFPRVVWEATRRPSPIDATFAKDRRLFEEFITW
jgi:hypothetical protein